ncbi:MAG TPA: hypothetical protein VD816_17840 [Ohtaekwangia sp.]|jgi:hypothetical protein|nr:hypothetical protein [Ohtaekwangia sp.]
MKAPLSERARKILSNPELAKQMMLAILAERLAERSSNPNADRPTIKLDGEELRLVRVRALSKK